MFDLRRTGTQATSSCSLTYEQEPRLDNSFEDEQAISLIFHHIMPVLTIRVGFEEMQFLRGSSNLVMNFLEW